MMKHSKTTITLLLLAVFFTAFQADIVGQVIQNDVFWKDTNGNPIYSQGGGVLKVGNTYYWYGVRYDGADDYYNNPAGGKNSGYQFYTMTCYSSTDLAKWKFEGNVMTTADGIGGWVGRVGAAYNSNTKKYVLVAQYGSGLMFATSSTPNGHFTLAGTQSTIQNVVNNMTGDQSVFVDDNGTAYLAFSNVSGRSHLYVAKLRSSDYLYVEPATNIYNAPAGREGNTMFKHNGVYYFLSSDLHGWNSSHTYCITATNVTGPYSSEFVMQGTDPDFSHVTQTGLSFNVSGSSGSFAIFWGDRWCDFAGNGVGYNQWVPITFNGTTPIFNSVSQWNINVTAGTWSVGSGNNYVLNPNFEADRISVTTITGWTNSGTGNSNTSGSHNPGRWAMAQSGSSAYTATMYQNISLPNGTYTLTAWVKSSGGQNSAKIYAKNFGGSEMNVSINHSIGSWTQVSISNINVTNGSIQVGIYSDAKAGNWVNADDFSLIGSSAPCSPTAITPYVQINEGTWNETTNVNVNVGNNVKFGPQPATGGSWRWSGPNGFSATTREVTIGNIQTSQAGNYVATYTNSCGAQSTATFTVSVVGTSITLSIQENETGFCSVDGTIDTNHLNYTGSGFANTNNATGAGVTCSVNVPTAQSCQVVWRYSNGSSSGARTGQIKVNGTVVGSTVNMATTADWDTWNETSPQTVNLSAGNNLIRLESIVSTGLPNIDYIKITGMTLTRVSCSGLKSGVLLSDITEEDDLNITCYPVPVKDQLNLVFNKELTENINIKLVNAVGEILYSTSRNKGLNHTINMTGLPNGFYLINITGRNINITKHIIK